jgi:hypothetical protein
MEMHDSLPRKSAFLNFHKQSLSNLALDVDEPQHVTDIDAEVIRPITVEINLHYRTTSMMTLCSSTHSSTPFWVKTLYLIG